MCGVFGKIGFCSYKNARHSQPSGTAQAAPSCPGGAHSGKDREKTLGKKTERRNKTVTVRFRTEPEFAEILSKKAEEAGLTLSEYLRAAAMGIAPRDYSKIENCISSLAQVSADEGRIGGLMKFALSEFVEAKKAYERAGQPVPIGLVADMLRAICKDLESWRPLKDKMSEELGRLRSEVLKGDW